MQRVPTVPQDLSVSRATSVPQVALVQQAHRERLERTVLMARPVRLVETVPWEQLVPLERTVCRATRVQRVPQEQLAPPVLQAMRVRVGLRVLRVQPVQAAMVPQVPQVQPR